jgi:hypothetical protein
VIPLGVPPGKIVPEKVYSNAGVQKDKILEENKGKSGVYR